MSQMICELMFTVLPDLVAKCEYNRFCCTDHPYSYRVSCFRQDEKSQHKNREKALKILRARLFDQLQEEAEQEQAAERRSQVGTGDRSERIRTLQFPTGTINRSPHRFDPL